jgi:hypothetical protein
MIQPTYVTFEQAKKLKEKKFDVECNRFYNKNGVLKWCFANGLGNNYKNQSLAISASEQWQVVEWLRVEHGIWVRLTTYAFGYQYHLDNTPDPSTWAIDRRYDCTDDFKTPQEAYSAAIDYVLNNLI